MENQVKGRILHIGQIESPTQNFSKRMVLVQTEGDYPQVIPVDFVNQKIQAIDGFYPGQVVTISFNLNGGDYESNGGKKYFVNLRGWKISAEGQQQAYNPNQYGQPQQGYNQPSQPQYGQPAPAQQHGYNPNAYPPNQGQPNAYPPQGQTQQYDPNQGYQAPAQNYQQSAQAQPQYGQPQPPPNPSNYQQGQPQYNTGAASNGGGQTMGGPNMGYQNNQVNNNPPGQYPRQ